MTPQEEAWRKLQHSTLEEIDRIMSETPWAVDGSGWIHDMIRMKGLVEYWIDNYRIRDGGIPVNGRL